MNIKEESEKIICLIHGPFNTVSGYGAHARDIARSVMKKYPDWDIKLFDVPWGNTPRNYLMKWRDSDIISKLIGQADIKQKPDVYISILIPPEFQQVGRFNVGITAGIETTICHHTWIEGLNKMDLVIVPSKHAKDIFLNTNYTKKHKNTGELLQKLEVIKPIEVLFEGVDKLTYYKTDMLSKTVADCLDEVKEEFAFLFVGHWLKGDFTHDRKDIGGMVETFIEAFKNKQNKPALVLKTSGPDFSVIDREKVMERLEAIRHNESMPNIYLIHGDMSDKEINSLYNHPKIKAMISLTHGEGYGRPLAEFAAIGKPIITTNWSGHIDFLHPNYSTLISGELKNVHKSAVQENIILGNSSWFYASYPEAKNAMVDMKKNYTKYKKKATRQAEIINKHYMMENMEDELVKILDKHLPTFPKEIKLELPKLKKTEE